MKCTNVKQIQIFCSKSEIRKGIDGLERLLHDSFDLDFYGNSIFLFSGWNRDIFDA